MFNLLFLCTGNSARSILAEAILNKAGCGRLSAFSAGSAPIGKVHPIALDFLRTLDYPVVDLRSKSWDEFSGSGAQKLDLGNFLQKRPFYPIQQIQKVAHEVRATRDIIFRQGSEPIRLCKSPPNAQNHVKILLFWGTNVFSPTPTFILDFSQTVPPKMSVWTVG